MFDSEIRDAPNNIDKTWAIIVHLLLVSPSFITTYLIAKGAMAFGLPLWIVIPAALAVTVLAISHAISMPLNALKEELIPISIVMFLMLVLIPVSQRAELNSQKRREQLKLKTKTQ